MKSCEFQAPRVPDQLQSLLTDDVLEVHGQWRELSLSDVKARMPEPEVFDIGDYHMRGVILKPENHDGDLSEALVIPLPYQQTWKPSMFIRSEIARQVVAPGRPAIVFPNNGWRDEYYRFTDSEYERLDGGSLRPLAEQQVRALEGLGVAKVAITGYSQGGITAIELGAVGSDKLEITHINSDEAPHADRDTKQLKKDFIESSGWGLQRASVRDARVPALSDALNAPRLGMDYARFGIAATLKTDSKAIMNAMSGTINESLSDVRRHNPDTPVKLGYIAGSQLFEVFTGVHIVGQIDDLRVKKYNGEAAHKHTTGDNVFAHALMAKDGIPVF